ncbi:acid phosphatase type 7-like isoform X2 [Haliotis cracherodii]|uniref:acid phosphatase type 7-like isoform X2 n=2 Tax=Haliotis cracherodii TaxID=6455 RepID=UPI0039E9068F
MKWSCVVCGVVFPALVLATQGILDHRTVYPQPEQIHLSYGATPDQMVVTWVTLDEAGTATVNYGEGKLDQTQYGKTTVFTDGGTEKRVLYIHRVLLSGLKLGHQYTYRCGSDAGYSSLFTFRAMKGGSDWSPQLAVFGDLGNENPRALPYLQEEAEAGHFDAIMHVGDFAYDFDTDNARLGDEFMRQLEPVAAMVPYMVCVGNHENAYNFSNYRNRFTMPGGDGEGMYFSWNIGPAHIISFSTEVYYYGVSTENIRAQYEWLEKDLQAANLPGNRAARPWIIVMGHKPMYCSNKDAENLCDNVNNPIRNGNKYYPASLEELFYKYGVDLEFYAHEHSYERLWPVYKTKICNGSIDKPYVNPQAPVHIVTGSAGDREGQTKFEHTLFPWTAFHTDDYGYTRMTVQNTTHLYLEEMSVDKKGAVIDKVWIVRDSHSAGQFNCQAVPR